jgi:hypothetical protein
MFELLRKRAERKVRVQDEAKRLIQQHGGQARHVLADQIREMEAKGQETKELWAVMQEVRHIGGDEGLDTATRWTEKK